MEMRISNMSKSSHNADLFRKHTGIGSFVLTSSHSYVVFGDAPCNDLICVGKTNLPHQSFLYLNGEKQRQSERVCADLFRRTESLKFSNALASFSLTDAEIQAIRLNGDSVNATHLRMHINDGKLRITALDYRKFDSQLRLSRKTSQVLRFLEYEIRVISDFSFTLKFDSFKKIPQKTYDVRVGDNGICQFSPHDSSENYLFRDQQLIEPLTVFHSPAIDQEICFVFHPTKDWVDLDTSPL